MELIMQVIAWLYNIGTISSLSIAVLINEISKLFNMFN